MSHAYGSMQCGRLNLGSAARMLRDFFHDQGLAYLVETEPDWSMGSIRFRISGPKEAVESAMAAVKEWAP